MVKRILENPRYLGKDGFPRLISDEDYRAVDRQRAGKTGYVPCPAQHPAHSEKGRVRPVRSPYAPGRQKPPASVDLPEP